MMALPHAAEDLSLDEKAFCASLLDGLFLEDEENRTQQQQHPFENVLPCAATPNVRCASLNHAVLGPRPMSLPVRVAVSKKQGRTNKVGVVFRQEAEEDIVVHRVSETSLFANTALRAGMRVLRINDLDATDLAQVMKELREAKDIVVIQAEEIPRNEPPKKKNNKLNKAGRAERRSQAANALEAAAADKVQSEAAAEKGGPPAA